MTDQTNGRAPDLVPAPRNSLTLEEGTTYTVERPTARKASALFLRLRKVNRVVNEVAKDLARFDREYGDEHVIELDRVRARLAYPAEPVMIDGEFVREPASLSTGQVDENGEAVMVPNPRAGELVLLPSPVDAISEEDWERSGHKLRRPGRPTPPERFAAVFEKAIEQGEEEVYRLLALFTMPNSRVTELRKLGGNALDEAVQERADDIADRAGLDEVFELAVVCAEVVDAQFRRKMAQIGSESLGKLMGLLGIKRAQEAPQTTQERPQTDDPSTDGAESSKPTSSTDLPTPTDGAPTSPSTPSTTSSSPSAHDLTATASAN